MILDTFIKSIVKNATKTYRELLQWERPSARNVRRNQNPMKETANAEEQLLSDLIADHVIKNIMIKNKNKNKKQKNKNLFN